MTPVCGRRFRLAATVPVTTLNGGSFDGQGGQGVQDGEGCTAGRCRDAFLSSSSRSNRRHTSGKRSGFRRGASCGRRGDGRGDDSRSSDRRPRRVQDIRRACGNKHGPCAASRVLADYHGRRRTGQWHVDRVVDSTFADRGHAPASRSTNQASGVHRQTCGLLPASGAAIGRVFHNA